MNLAPLDGRVWGDRGSLHLSSQREPWLGQIGLCVSYPERLKEVSLDMLLNTEAVIGTEGIEK